MKTEKEALLKSMELPAKKQPSHTPTPWSVAKGMSLDPDALPYCVGRSLDGKMTPFQTAGTRAEANAAHIVKCVNNHDKLIMAMRNLICMVTDSRLHGPELIEACQAIGNAEGPRCRHHHQQNAEGK